MKKHFCPVEQAEITFQDQCNWCDATETTTPIKLTHKIAYDYVQALLTQNAGEFWVQRAFNTLGSDNQVFSLSDPLRKAYAELVQESIGEHLWDWLEWWIYETNFGENSMLFTIQQETYDPTNLTLYKFLEIVDA